MKSINFAIIGTRFMGRAHSNAYRQAAQFFDIPYQPVLKVACGQNERTLREFANNWGWQEIETDWRKVVERADVDVIDIAVPPNLHKKIAIAAAQNGKHIFCEKPMALSAQEARTMLAAARSAGVLHYLNHNYRRLPAVAYARQMIAEGRIGEIFQWRGTYLQEWMLNPNNPIDWHLRKEISGAGPLFDLGVHSIDLASYIAGEICAVSALLKNFIPQRPLEKDASKMVAVTVEDAGFLLLEFASGAIGSLDCSWVSAGRINYNTFEVYGSKGALLFNLERMNNLQYYDYESPAVERGFRDMMITEANHPYFGAWWPPGHIIGYEHTFIHAVVDFLRALEKGADIRPNFEDGVKEMEVLEAALESARTGKKITLGG